MVSPEPRDPFRRLEPPAGGLPGLRVRLDRRAARRGLVAPALAMAAACAALLVAVLRPPAPPGPAALILPDDPALRSLGLLDGSNEAVSVPAERAGDLAVLRLETGVAGVTYYRVTVTGEPTGGR